MVFQLSRDKAPGGDGVGDWLLMMVDSGCMWFRGKAAGVLEWWRQRRYNVD